MSRVGRKRFTGGLDVFVFNQTISTAVFNYNASTEFFAAGWDGIKPVHATINIVSPGIIRSTSTYGLRLPPMPAQSMIRLNIGLNAYIEGGPGYGGAGAPPAANGSPGSPGTTGYESLLIEHPVSIENFGSIYAGSGGGGGGGNAISYGSPQLNSAGGAGGGRNGAAVAGAFQVDGARYSIGGTGGAPGQSGGDGATDSGVVGLGGQPGQPGPAVIGIGFVTYIRRGTIGGAEI